MTDILVSVRREFLEEIGATLDDAHLTADGDTQLLIDAAISNLRAALDAKPADLIDGPGVEEMVPLRIEYEPGYPEDVAFGSQMQMDRLKKWLDKFFVLLRKESEPVEPVAVPDWQPIETAPRGSGEDGPGIVTHPDYVQPPSLLLLTPEGMTVGAYDWYYHEGYGNGAEPGVPAWRQAMTYEPIYDITHWMPLPQPPASKENEE